MVSERLRNEQCCDFYCLTNKVCAKTQIFTLYTLAALLDVTEGTNTFLRLEMALLTTC